LDASAREQVVIIHQARIEGRSSDAKAVLPDLDDPACVTVIATARVEPGVTGSSRPSAPVQSFSVIAVGKMRSVSPVSTTS